MLSGLALPIPYPQSQLTHQPTSEAALPSSINTQLIHMLSSKNCGLAWEFPKASYQTCSQPQMSCVPVDVVALLGVVCFQSWSLHVSADAAA